MNLVQIFDMSSNEIDIILDLRYNFRFAGVYRKVQSTTVVDNTTPTYLKHGTE
jgi:hypothetical protein